MNESGEEILLRIIRQAKEGKTDEEIEAETEAIIEDVKKLPRSEYYWDSNDGWKRFKTMEEYLAERSKKPKERTIIDTKFEGHLNVQRRRS